MNRKKRNCSISNRGFTMVELLVSMFILSIVIIIVTSFLYIGSKSYSNANQEITKQMDTQTVINQLEDLIVKSHWVKLVDLSAQEVALIIYSMDDCNIVICNKTDKNLYLVEGTSSVLSHLSSITYTEEENLMTKNVSDLKLLIDEANMKTKKELHLEVDFSIGGKEYPLIRSIRFRNQLVKPTDIP